MMFCSASSADSGRLDVVVRQVLGVAFGYDGDLDTVVERGQKLRQRRAPRLATAAQFVGIDLGPGHEIVEPANAVPRAIQPEVRAKKNEAAPGVLVLGGAAAAERGQPRSGSRILDALALSERVVGQAQRSLCARGSRTASGTCARPCRSANGRAAPESPDDVPDDRGRRGSPSRRDAVGSRTRPSRSDNPAAGRCR